MGSETALNQPSGHRERERPRPRTVAAAYWARTGIIIPGCQGVVARYRQRLTEYHEECAFEVPQEGQGQAEGGGR